MVEDGLSDASVELVFDGVSEDVAVSQEISILLPSDEQSLLPRMQRGLRGQSLDSVRETLNAWYAAHPDRMQRPVIETIWFEMVVPGLQQDK